MSDGIVRWASRTGASPALAIASGLAAASLLGVAAPASAQQPSAQQPSEVAPQATPVPPPPSTSTGPSQLEEVVVTGSRIRRRDYTSLSPIVTVGAPRAEVIP